MAVSKHFLVLLFSIVPTNGFQIMPTPERYRWLQEAESKHGRAAMVAVPTLFALQSFTGQDPVSWLNAQPLITQCVFYASAAAAEVPSLKRLDKGFRIKEGLTPGKLIETATPTELATTCEKNLGRLAMLVTTLFFASSIANL